MQCGKCMFWRSKEGYGEGFGECHRYASRPLWGRKPPDIISWPMTHKDDFCGDFGALTKA